MLKLFFIFFKIGAFTLGGGYAMLPMIQNEIVAKNRWIDEARFIELLAMAQSCPGPIAVNTSVFIGYKIFGLPGAIVACLGIVLPSVIAILAIVLYLSEYRSNKHVEAVFKALKPAVIALIAAPIYGMAKKIGFSAPNLIIAVLACVSVAVFKVSAPLVIVFCVFAGLLGNNLGTIATK